MDNQATYVISALSAYRKQGFHRDHINSDMIQIVLDPEIFDELFSDLNVECLKGSNRFGLVLKKARKQFRYTIRKFHQLMDIDSSYISDLEQGVIEPTVQDYDMICRFIDKSNASDYVRDSLKLELISVTGISNIVPQKELKPAFPPRMVKKDES